MIVEKIWILTALAVFINAHHNGLTVCHRDKVDFKNMVTIWYKDQIEQRLDKRLIAAGTMITSRHVLTSFSAIDEYQVKDLEVFAGECSDSSHIQSVRKYARTAKEGEAPKECISRYDIQGIHSIPAYRLVGNLHDIAIIHLKTNVNPLHVSIVCITKEKIPRKKDRVQNSVAQFLVTGWGRIDDYGMASLNTNNNGEIEQENCGNFIEHSNQTVCHDDAYDYLKDHRKLDYLIQWGAKNPRTMCLQIFKGQNACHFYTKGGPILDPKLKSNKHVLWGISLYSLRCGNLLLATDVTTYGKFIVESVTKDKSSYQLNQGLCQCDNNSCHNL